MTILRSMTLTRRGVLGGGLSLLAMGALPSPGRAAPTTQETLIYGVPTIGGEILDPVIANGNVIEVIAVLFDSLFTVDESNKIAPGFVDSWEISDDARTWTLHLRKDVVFHDGSPVTADDVLFSLVHSTIKDAQRGGLWRSILGDTPNVEIIDPYNMKIITPDPQPNLAEFATHRIAPYMLIMPKAYYEKNGADYFNKNPMGSGPYKFVQQISGQEIDFEAVDYKHWRVDPAFKTIKVIEVPEETTRVAMLETGQMDATHVSLENAARLRDAKYQLAFGSDTCINVNLIGTYLPEAQNMPLSNIKVREALSLAINRQELSDTLLSGFGSADVINEGIDWTNSVWSPELIAKWKPILQKAYRFDRDEAKRLIAEAGYPNGFEFTLWVGPEGAAPFLPDLMQAVAAYWEAVGAHVNLVQVDATAWKGARNTNISKQLVGAGGTNAQGMKPVPEDSFIFHSSKYGNMNVLSGSPLEATVDKLVLGGWSSVNQDEHRKLFDQLLDVTTFTWTAWPIIKAATIVAMGPRASGDIKLDLQNPTYNIPYWKFVG